MQRASIVLFSAAFTLAAPAHLSAARAVTPDRIYQSNGSILEDVTITEQGLTSVKYKPSGSKNETEVDTELVLEVEFSNKPEALALADVDASQEAFGSALAGMQDFLQNIDSKTEKKFPWAKDYARYRIVELGAIMNDVGQVVAAADAVAAEAPESRYLPLAMIKKTEVLLVNGDTAGAKAAADAFKAVIADKGLSQRWRYEQELLALRADGTKTGEALEKELTNLAKSAATFPTVTNAADVLAAQSLLSRSKFDEAEELFRGVTEDPAADDSTLAAAWTGLGDCLYRRAEALSSPDDEEAAKELFNEARRAFMRTVVNYRYEYAYVAQAAFYAGRCFQEIGGEGSSDSSSRLFRFVLYNFKGSKWADSAKEFERRNK